MVICIPAGLRVHFAMRFILAVTLFYAFQSLARAESPPAANSVKDGAVLATLMAEPTHIQPGVSFWIGIRLTMEREWHTYWRNPGDSGGPTEIEWILPEGYEAGPTAWPAPSRIDTPPLTSYGYENDVLLLSRITPPPEANQGSGSVVISARVKWLMCRDVCLPGSAALEIALPVMPGPADANPKYAALFTAARTRLPAASDAWQFKGTASSELIELFVIPPEELRRSVGDASFFPYDPDLIDHAFTQLWLPGDGGYRLVMKRSDYSDTLPVRLEGVLVWGDEQRAIEVNAEWSGGH